MPDQLTDRQWQTLRADQLTTWAAHQRPCWICKQPIDYQTPLMTNGVYNPHAPTADHIHPRGQGGDKYDPNNLAPAHHRCNSKRRDTTPNRRNPSRRW